MVILMSEDSRKKDVGQVLAVLEKQGFKPRIISTAPRMVLGLVEEVVHDRPC